MLINILNFFEETVARVPEKIAIIENESNITFFDLQKKAKTLARQIINMDSNLLNKPIAVYLPKSIECIVADIAITYSGNVYMNLDVKSPKSRVNNIVQLIKPQYIITTKNYNIDFLDEGISILYVDQLEDLLAEDDSIGLRLEKIIDTDPLCIINTSGSTGTPKGVVLNHKSFIDFTQWANEVLKIGDSEVVGSLSPVIFDIYSFELCMLMSRGNTLVLIQESLSAFPVKILQILQERQVTFIFWVPTIMVNIANMQLLEKVSLPKLKTVWFAGEIFPTKQFNYWKKNLHNTKFVNLYGPIEITLDCIYYIVERSLLDEEPIPIGYACKNTDILILKEDNTLAQGGEEGEICVRGTSLAMGYYNNPEKTALAFVQNPLNAAYPEIIYRTGDIATVNEYGEIIFKGRKDSLVKHLGYRIELSEIEHVILNTLKLVKNCCAVYDFENKEIVLFYEKDKELSVAEFRKQIATMLPKYMIPTTYIEKAELPRNPNGKIDRLGLREEYKNRW